MRRWRALNARLRDDLATKSDLEASTATLTGRLEGVERTLITRMEATDRTVTERMSGLERTLGKRINARFSKTVAAVAVMLLGNLAAVYAIIASFMRAGAS